MKSIKASAPATVANVSCGFDIFGFAVEAPADEVVVTLKVHAKRDGDVSWEEKLEKYS